MISTNQFKNGMTIVLDNSLFEIVEFQHVKPGKGGAFVRTKLKKLDTGGVVDKTFRAGEKFELAHLDHKKLQYLYSDGSDYHFMDNETYEQLQLDKKQVGSTANFMVEGMEIDASFHKGKLLSIRPPITVELKVVESEPGIKGDTAQGATKPVKLETGLSVNVPLFVNQGDTLKIDTRTSQYIERV